MACVYGTAVAIVIAISFNSREKKIHVLQFIWLIDWLDLVNGICGFIYFGKIRLLLTSMFGFASFYVDVSLPSHITTTKIFIHIHLLYLALKAFSLFKLSLSINLFTKIIKIRKTKIKNCSFFPVFECVTFNKMYNMFLSLHLLAN